MDKHINLLCEDDDVGYFAWIKNLSRIVSTIQQTQEQEILLRSVCT